MPVNLGKREHDLMDVLWERGPSTVAEVREAVGTSLAYTTVLTILRNLEAKGAVSRWGEGRAHRYFAVVARDDAREGALQRLIDRFFAGSHDGLLTHLVEARKVSPEQLAELRLLIDRQRDTDHVP
ncbi:MAG: BlaI/MecI/CopY family transcriptional regulator [Cytophagaceae bacterium]|nr:BlaI/MecI/CopY family transcriptional regulator [Gemmatimonadaceae bacterium]